MGSALTGYQEFRNHGLHVVAAFDTDPSKTGKTIHQVQIFPLEKLKEVVEKMNITLAILTVPSSYAQSSCDAIVASGIHAIWNFTNVKLKVPEDVLVQREDLSSGYAILSVMMRTKAGSLA